MKISFGSTYLLNLNQKLDKKPKSDEYKRERFKEIIEERLPNNNIKSDEKDYMCISVKEKADESVDNILKKYGFIKYKKSGKHNLSNVEMQKALTEYIEKN